MTDTIGWGGVDDAPHRRRISRRLVWPALGVVVAGAALTPTVRNHLADNAAGRLQRQWATAKALDASRRSIEQSTVLLLGVGDGPRFGRIVQSLDRSEATQLSRLSSQIEHDRTWSGDLHRVTVAVHRALTAQVHDLVADAGHAPAVIQFTMYPPEATSPATQRIVDTADAAVTAAARRHHVVRAHASSARLSPPSALLAPLSRVTDSPVDAELAVMHDNNLDIWDLRAGRRIRTISVPKFGTGDAQGDNDGGPLVVVGHSLLQGFFGDLRLVPLDGRPPLRLGGSDALGYLPAGTSGLWAVTGDRARRYDVDGRPHGPARPLPYGTRVAGVITATSDAIVLAVTTGRETAGMVVWHPESGRQLTITTGCGGAAGSRRTVIFTDCAQRSVQSLDVETGRIRRLRLPSGFLADGAFVPAPDGSRVALSVQPSGPATTPDQQRLAIADFASGTFTVLPRAANPIGWSADGSVLLAQPQDVSTVVRLAPLGYWMAGMHDLAAVRIDVRGARITATLL